ncbi:hypothetical protein BH10BAC1_BH10BAC1_14070 [soil metagenome]
MKKNDWAIIISVLVYGTLFYDQTAGINFLLFNIMLVGLLLNRRMDLIKSKVWLSVAVGAIASSFFIFMYGSALAIWANLFSLFILSALSINPNTSFLTSIFLTICSVGSSCVFMFIDWVKRKSKQVAGVYQRPFYVKLFLFTIPFLIAILFFFFYQTSNPLFYDFTKNINLDFISIGWIFFTLAGLLLLYGFFYNNIMPSFYEMDSKVTLNLTAEIASRKNFFNSLMRIDNENLSGIILFVMLNSLLLILNMLDANYFLFNGKLPEGVNHKGFVHDGIGTLIMSIIVAIVIILFYFRGNLNFYKQSKWLKIMALLWIAQNAFMIFSTAYRNNLYIEESGISYKKIGVYVYLILALIGLATTFIKVVKLKTNWYLFRTNASMYYYFIVFACFFNWDVIITNFNIKKYTDEHKKLEKYLLIDLSYKNLPQLLSLPDSAANSDDSEARDYYNFSRGTYYYDYKTGLSSKLYNFMKEYKQMEWQSYCSEKTRTFNDLVALKDKVQAVNFQYNYFLSLEPLTLFDNLRSFTISNGSMQNLSELKRFPKLEKLTITSSGLDTLDELPAFKSLRELDLSGNSITDLHPLEKIKSIEVLNISGDYNRIKSYAPLLALKKLKVLRLGIVSPEGIETLKHTFPNVKIETTNVYVNQSR